MRKALLITIMIAAPLSVALAQNITFDTAIRWNTDVIKQALKDTGIIPNTYSDVDLVHHSILNALLKLDTFSARQAIEVCMKKCNESQMLREGGGNSRKKCPQLCEEFASSLVIANNDVLSGDVEQQYVYTTYFGYDYELVITTFKDEEHSSKDFCKILAADAFKRGAKYPMLCDGNCGLLGQDIIEVSGSARKRLLYEVGDFCDGVTESAGRKIWTVHADGTIEKYKK